VRRRLCSMLTVLVAGMVGLGALLPITAEAATPSATVACRPIMVYGVRGSGESYAVNGGLGGTVGSFVQRLNANYPAGTVGFVADDYEAVDIRAAVLSPRRYGNSVRQGVSRMLTDITALRTACPSTQLVLAGYSQGADVIRRAASQLPSERTGGFPNYSAIVLFGDPTFITDEPYSGTADVIASHINMAPHVITVGSFDPRLRGIERNGALNAFTGLPAPPAWSGNPAVILSYCHNNDIVCGSRGIFDPHFTYGDADASLAADAVPAFISGGNLGGQTGIGGGLVPNRQLLSAFIYQAASPRRGMLRVGVLYTSAGPSASTTQYFDVFVNNLVKAHLAFDPEVEFGNYGDDLAAAGIRSGQLATIAVRVSGAKLAEHRVVVS
jgi:pimeloyl-ACP methyl ester carboxylesterase